ncbi:MAG: hypothetical protein ACJZ70_00160 [Limisphaerales bacterium]
MSCNGHPTIHTPNLDQMAYQGQKMDSVLFCSSCLHPESSCFDDGASSCSLWNGFK